jgi:hypothetical protein
MITSCPVSGMELAKDVLHLHLDGAPGSAEPVANFLVTQAFRDEVGTSISRGVSEF